jgi:hypothetical protein
MLDRAGFESVPFRRVDLGGLDRRRDRRSFRRSPRSDRRSIFAVVPNSKTSSIGVAIKWHLQMSRITQLPRRNDSIPMVAIKQPPKVRSAYGEASFQHKVLVSAAQTLLPMRWILQGAQALETYYATFSFCCFRCPRKTCKGIRWSVTQLCVVQMPNQLMFWKGVANLQLFGPNRLNPFFEKVHLRPLAAW